ncbi:MAG: NADPH-dependent F420 reductase [Microcoleus sp. PH2017_10_PVI_O_A]|uniref:NADPH-dependent F420 reductase n=1 Tax=unclassified Microcoleus TaxID=2642155 RepID=UPI001D21983B|nr:MULTISPECIES: NADPH-dependent F420 reductase [unclassified Microcoleus]TAE74569.1 MAG: F420-dependent NADP oxidoreductase [Oscillatoriales cyanobacterium]MCC3409698.1 NADPH-dependent F420 reductase [Microcoleus sp. PH2017_10_PVI_O_A]MCC3463972.1 NADPH-dependent F420 reductase [Microcoleus sp. PH2017_11_PCY_U_A]MCC3482297.1 NADPH-dependent F420 reductase [Microcoleus sp. PH2017_12_PCY_D_A]MCC3532135.1 NADPH-dependent F420 reductase [Microcoleus sp. PH2017_21_RUC_O_A]
MKIGIIGAGNVGGTLGRILTAKGHSIVFGVRDPQSAKVQSAVEATGGNARAASVGEAASHGQVSILATPWNGTQEAIAAAGDLTGKIIIDATNPIEMTPAGLAAGLTIGHTTSAAEEIAKWAIGSQVVKAFNNIGASCFENLQFGSQTATAFICGDNADAKKIVTNLAEDIGFEVVDAGALKQARLLEPLGMLWINLAFSGMGQDFAINLIKR